MVVQHNMQAMNSNRMLGVTTSSQAKSTEKLSSGYKINRAADDAAGLSISEKMRSQIKGLTQASANAQDGISCVQTAEGALTEVHSMLQRMNELAVKASNGTMSEEDRQNVQDEVDQLLTEIDRVSETTKFNETYLLKGNGTDSSKTLAAKAAGFSGILGDSENGKTTFQLDKLREGDTIKIAGKDYKIAPSDKVADYIKLVAGTDATAGDKIVRNGETIVVDDKTPADVIKIQVGDVWFNHTDNTTKTVTAEEPEALETTQTNIKKATAGDTVTINGKDYTVGVSTKDDSSAYTADDIAAMVKAGDEVEMGGAKKTVVGGPASTEANAITLDKAYSMIADELTKANSIGADTAATVKHKGAGEFEITQGCVHVKESLSVGLHVGADSETTNKITMNIDALNTAGLGIKGLKVGDDTTGTNATYAIDSIKDAIKTVSAQRSELGAVQNRLEHTIANLDNVVENTTAAESQIRDTDMASEMVNYSKNNILSQAGQSMLAQANQSTQGVLSLLQ